MEFLFIFAVSMKTGRYQARNGRYTPTYLYVTLAIKKQKGLSALLLYQSSINDLNSGT